MALVVASVMMGYAPIYIAAVIGASVMVLTGCLTMEHAYRAIDWRAIFLIAGMLPLGTAMQQTGAATYLADQVMLLLGDAGPWPVIMGLYILTAMATMIIPTAALVVLMSPIVLSAMSDMGLAPQTAMMAVAMAASCELHEPDLPPREHSRHGSGRLSVRRLPQGRCAADYRRLHCRDDIVADSLATDTVMSEQIVVAGAGHAAGQVVATLKQKKFGGKIIVIGDEPYLPYQRPPLSKKFLSGEMPAERLYFKPASFYDDPNIEFRLGTTVTEIDRNEQAVTTDGGDAVSYDKLILAVGSRVRTVPAPGSDLGNIHYLRSIGDVEKIRGHLASAHRAVIVGAGYIGLEVAAVLKQAGLDVTVIEMADRVMSRVVSPDVSAFYEREHIRQGVTLELSTALQGFQGDGTVSGVDTVDGRTLPADFVVIGAGILPNTGLAESAGLAVDNGIVVDDHCRTSDPNIFAVGDCTSHPNAIYDRCVRLESVHNALEQAKTAAANACGEDVSYSQVPWFWSDQYDLKLQIAGLSEGYDDVVIRGNPDDRSFSCVYLREGCVIAIDAVNAPRDFMQAKPLIANAARPPRTELADASISLKDLG